MTPLICTSNTYSHIDYGVPLYATKSTDYRTSTGTYNRQIPCFPQQFDCVSIIIAHTNYTFILSFQRVKARIKDTLLRSDSAILADVKTTYGDQYWPKDNQCDVTEKNPRAPPLTNVHYTRGIQEKVCFIQLLYKIIFSTGNFTFQLCQHPPIPLLPRCSEMKDSYRMKSCPQLPKELNLTESSRCEVIIINLRTFVNVER